MKVICDRAALLDAVNSVCSVAATRSPKPALTCVKLTAEKGGDAGSLVLEASDGEHSLRMRTASVEVQEPGEALVPGAKLREIVAAEDADSTLTLETVGEQMQIRGADAKFNVFTRPVGEFPPLPDVKDAGGASFLAPARDLQRIIARTLFATAKETSRYAINGVLLKCTGGRIDMVATDGRRLALAKMSIKKGPKGNADIQCIIPSKALNLASRVMGGIDADDEIAIAISDSQAFFVFGDESAPDAVIVSSLVEGAFPPYEDVIPKEQDHKATFDVATLTSAVRRAALLTNEESRGVSMVFETAGKKDTTLRLRSRAPEMGEAEITVGLDGYDGDDIEIGFNPHFILDALKVLESKSVVIEMKAPNKPGTIRSDNDFVYVVMPVNLQ